MSYTKWIGAALGWAFYGPIGAIIGLALGSVFDNVNDNSPKKPYTKTHSRPYEPQKKRKNQYRTTSGDFEVSLLILASIVIKADGTQDQRELDFVRNQFKSMYGKERSNHAFELFRKVSQQQISKRQVSLQVKQMMDHPSRLQLVHFLFGIAKADGHVSQVEVKEIYSIANYLGIGQKDYESIKAMFVKNGDNAYTILEISASATNEEVKKAYRKMVKKYHPDRVTHLGEEHKAGAEEKFKKVQEAYDYIQKERGF